MNILALPKDTLNHTLSFLRINDISIMVTLCHRTVEMQQQIYRSVRIANIYDEIHIKKVVDTCPNIKHLTLLDDITLSNKHIQLLQKLDLESFYFNNVQDSDDSDDSDDDSDDDNEDDDDDRVKIPFKNLKTISLYRLSYCDLRECKRLEKIIIDNLDRHIEADDFPNLKSVIINGFKDDTDDELIQFDIPITELTIKMELTDEILKLPLRKLEIDGGINEIDINVLTQLPLEELTIHKSIDKRISLNNMKLTSLTFSHSNLSYTINMKTLRNLCLDSMKVDLSNLRTLVNLNSLSLKECVYTRSGFKYLESLPITSLCIFDSVIDIDTISKFKLTYLSLGMCNFDSSDIMKLPLTLMELRIFNTKHSIISDIPYFSKLHTLYINYSTRLRRNRLCITDDGMEAISKLPVINLTLSNCGLYDDNMDYIARMNINELNLEYNNITILGIRKLKKLPLRKLDIMNVPILHLIQC